MQSRYISLQQGQHLTDAILVLKTHVHAVYLRSNHLCFMLERLGYGLQRADRTAYQTQRLLNRCSGCRCQSRIGQHRRQ